MLQMRMLWKIGSLTIFCLCSWCQFVLGIICFFCIKIFFLPWVETCMCTHICKHMCAVPVVWSHRGHAGGSLPSSTVSLSTFCLHSPGPLCVQGITVCWPVNPVFSIIAGALLWLLLFHFSWFFSLPPFLCPLHSHSQHTCNILNCYGSLDWPFRVIANLS